VDLRGASGSAESTQEAIAASNKIWFAAGAHQGVGQRVDTVTAGIYELHQLACTDVELLLLDSSRVGKFGWLISQEQELKVFLVQVLNDNIVVFIDVGKALINKVQTTTVTILQLKNSWFNGGADRIHGPQVEKRVSGAAGIITLKVEA